MLGYFHYVFVADGHVFDFDLATAEVLPFAHYIRLQFTPAMDPYDPAQDLQRMRDDLPSWTLKRIELPEMLLGGNKTTWEKKLRDLVSIDRVFELRREYCAVPGSP